MGCDRFRERAKLRRMRRLPRPDQEPGTISLPLRSNRLQVAVSSRLPARAKHLTKDLLTGNAICYQR